jgi:hypothetical protein
MELFFPAKDERWREHSPVIDVADVTDPQLSTCPISASDGGIIVDRGRKEGEAKKEGNR